MKLEPALLALVGNCFLASYLVAASSNRLIYNVKVISPERETAKPHSYVLLRDERIVAVGDGPIPTVPSDTQKIDGQGRYLIPGLIDGHVHLGSVPGMKLQDQKKLSTIVEEYEKQLSRSYLYFGFTTVIDLAVVDRPLIDRIKKAPLAPDIFDCADPVPIANGYPMNYIDSPDRFQLFKNFLFDSRQKEKIPKEFKESDHTPKAAVARVKRAGGVCVKTHYEPGFDGVDLPTPTLATLSELARESDRAGLPLLIHANSLQAQSFSLRANPKIFAHGLWNWGKYQNEPGLPKAVQETLDKIIEKNIATMPTFQVLGGTHALFDPDYLKSPQIKKVVPATLFAWMKSKDGQWFVDLLRKELQLSDQQIAKANEKRSAQLGLTVDYLLKNRGRLLFGSDTPASPTYGNLPGWNGYLELRKWANAHVPLPLILRTATLANAQAFGLDKDYGSVAPGKVANLLLLEKNPLETVEAYDSIQSVLIRGELIERGKLSAE